MTASEIIERLGLERHPEGGWYRETFRDTAGSGRAASTAILFLLEGGQRSHWHRVDASEVWHHYAGAPLKLLLSEGHGVRELRLGDDLAGGEIPQAVAPAGWWQAAQSEGEWTLVGCTVAPGFDFSGFEMAPPGWEPGEPEPSE